MNVKPVQTPKITDDCPQLSDLIDSVITAVPEQSVIAVTSKIVSICEGRIIPAKDADKAQLIDSESQYYIPPEQSKYNITLTITRNMLVPTAGIDESNGNGYFILWPEDPYASARLLRDHIVQKHKRKNVGILITDSKTTPMRYGTTGTAIAYAGFAALNNYIGTPDLFGRTLEVTKANVADGLAAAAVAVMGEGNEQTPIAVITDIPFVKFDAQAPSPDEQDELHIDIKEDLYGPLYTTTAWIRGKGK